LNVAVVYRLVVMFTRVDLY